MCAGFLFCSESGSENFFNFSNFGVKNFLGSSFTDESEIRLCIGRSYIEPPVRELDSVTVEVHECGRLLLTLEMSLDGLHGTLLVLNAEVDFA